MVGGRDYDDDAVQPRRAGAAASRARSSSRSSTSPRSNARRATATIRSRRRRRSLDEPFEWTLRRPAPGGPPTTTTSYRGEVTGAHARSSSRSTPRPRASPSASACRADPRHGAPHRHRAARCRRTRRSCSAPPRSRRSRSRRPTPSSPTRACRPRLRAATKVVDRHGQIVERRPLAVERVVSAEAAYLVTHLMEGVLDRGTGTRRARARLHAPGGGQDRHDQRRRATPGSPASRPDLLAVVWVGFDDGAPLGLTGAEAALPIWTDFMKTRDGRGAAGGLPCRRPVLPWCGSTRTREASPPPAAPRRIVEAFSTRPGTHRPMSAAHATPHQPRSRVLSAARVRRSRPCASARRAACRSTRTRDPAPPRAGSRGRRRARRAGRRLAQRGGSAGDHRHGARRRDADAGRRRRRPSPMRPRPSPPPRRS